MEKKPLQKVIIKTKDGEPFKVPPEGSLGLLALGYKGLLAWRNARRQFQKAKKQAAGQNLNTDEIMEPGEN